MTTPARPSKPEPLHKIVSPGLLRTLMQRTGTGASVTVRELAAKAGVPHGTVGNLLTGEQRAVSADAARGIAAAVGVDLLILFIPLERSAEQAAAPSRDAVSA